MRRWLGQTIEKVRAKSVEQFALSDLYLSLQLEARLVALRDCAYISKSNKRRTTLRMRWCCLRVCLMDEREVAICQASRVSDCGQTGNPETTKQRKYCEL